MAERTVNIELVEQVPQARRLRFFPALTSIDDGVLLEEKYEVTTDAEGVATIELPVLAEGTVRYDLELPSSNGKTKARIYLPAGDDPINLSELLALSGGLTDNITGYIDQAVANKQNTLVSGSNIKTINGDSVLGFGDLEVTGAIDSVNGQIGVVVLTKSDVGLGNVDNTADTAKPVSTLQQAAIDDAVAGVSIAFEDLTGEPTDNVALDGTLFGIAATGTYTFGANPANGQVLAGILDDFWATFNDDADNDGGIQIGATLSDTLDNLVFYLNDQYFGGTMFSHPSANVLKFTNDVAGTVGNDKVLWYEGDTTAPVTVSGDVSAGGIDGIEQEIDAVAAAAAAAIPQLATATEVLTGTDTAKAVTPAALAALWDKGADIASAATIVIGEGGWFHITGGTSITDIDPATDKAGREFGLIFDSAGLTLTHHATTLILPGGANITVAAGDVARFISEGSDAVRCVEYTRSNGTPVGGFGGVNGSAAAPTFNFLLDPDTGVYRATANTLGIAANGVAQATFPAFSTNTAGNAVGGATIHGMLILAANNPGEGDLLLDRTITPGGTTGARTIDRMAGTVNFAAGASSVTVTDAMVNANSIIFCTIRTNDATAVIKNVVPGAGSFVINLSAPATAETSVGFLVTN